MYNKSYSTCIPNSVKWGLIMAATNKVKMQQINTKLKSEDLNHLREYADKKGGNTVSHYIKETVAEFMEIHT